MQLLAREFAERAERTPGDVAVIDALGVHTVGEVMAAARDLAIALEESLGGSPTVLVQADNTWRTLATALAVGCAAAWWPCSAATPSPRSSSWRWRTSSPTPWSPPTASWSSWAVSSAGVPRQAGRARRLGARHLRPARQRRRPLGRRRGGRHDLGLDRPAEVRGAVRGVAALRRPLDDRRDRARARRRRRRLRPALVRGGVLLRDVPARDAGRPDGLHRELAARRRPRRDGRPRRPLDDAGADDGAAALDPPDGAGSALAAAGR